MFDHIDIQRALAKEIAGVPRSTQARPPAPVKLTRGVVTGVSIDADGSTIINIKIDGSATAIPADVVVGGYTPNIGEDVDVLLAPPRVVVLSGPSAAPSIPIIWDLPGDVIVGASDYFTAHVDMRLGTITGNLLTPGTADVILNVMHNTVTVATVGLPVGSLPHQQSVDISMKALDVLQVNVTNAGKGAKGLSVVFSA